MGRFLDDPLTLAIAPPPDETPAQRQVRETAESEAQRVSDAIDEQLRRERDVERRKKKPLRLLLLGQSESGKTATLKNFHLTFARREWMEERASWRSVIQLNLVRNVNDTLDHLAREMSAVSFPAHNYHDSDYSSDDLEMIDTKSTKDMPPLKFTEKHRLLKLRLGPLRGVQTDLERGLGAASAEVYSTSVTTAAPFEHYSGRRACHEFSINSSNGWKSALDKFRTMRTARPAIGPGSQRKKMNDTESRITEIIASCRDDMMAIWEDPMVREMLSRHKARIEDSPGFFLDAAERIAVSDYQPTDDDVIRARLRTLGVQEYRFTFEKGRTTGQEWRLYDVGGTRSSRAAWYPYFDDVDAVIFLAPISCFNEKLTEDRHVNRLEDSYSLWRSLCSCKLLAQTQIILFLNKCDLLEAKLSRGVKIKDHVPSYGDRKNDLAAAVKYFQQHFKGILKKYSPVARPFYVHLTSVIDTKSTADTLGQVEESILLHHLHQSKLI